jgi:hypothetical protein
MENDWLRSQKSDVSSVFLDKSASALIRDVDGLARLSRSAEPGLLEKASQVYVSPSISVAKRKPSPNQTLDLTGMRVKLTCRHFAIL